MDTSSIHENILSTTENECDYTIGLFQDKTFAFIFVALFVRHQHTRSPTNRCLFALVLGSGHAISLNKNVILNHKASEERSEPPLFAWFSLPPSFFFCPNDLRRTSAGYRVDNDHLKIFMLIDTTVYSVACRISYVALLRSCSKWVRDIGLCEPKESRAPRKDPSYNNDMFMPTHRMCPLRCIHKTDKNTNE